MKAISARLGTSAETLRKWVRQAEVDAGEAPGVPTESARELRELKPQVRGAGTHHRGAQGGDEFLRAGVRPAVPLICEFITEHQDRFGVAPICRALTFPGVPIAPRTYWAHGRRRRRNARCGT